jgi:DNA-binding NtrC family response regulator
MEGTVKVLIVDDEINILHALERLFSDCDFSITTVTSAKDAMLLFSSDGPYDVVLSDYLMPGMNGVDFLTWVHTMRPETVGIILSGHADMPLINKAICDGLINRFMAKPWDSEALLAMIEEVQTFAP